MLLQLLRAFLGHQRSNLYGWPAGLCLRHSLQSDLALTFLPHKQVLDDCSSPQLCVTSTAHQGSLPDTAVLVAGAKAEWFKPEDFLALQVHQEWGGAGRSEGGIGCSLAAAGPAPAAACMALGSSEQVAA